MKVKVSYRMAMSTLSTRGHENDEVKLIMNLDNGDTDVLDITLDDRGVMCFKHNGELNDLPITIDVIDGNELYFEIEV